MELLGKDGNKVRLDIDGQPYEVDIVMAENGACSILHDGHSYNAELIRSGGGKNYQVSSDCRVREILVKEGNTVNVNQVLMTLEVINQEENAERRGI